mmetsp:Transcript_6447/g.19110  ORF Transcript_6447/g.19110 Transcript_6447/m.19110 type:complete len:1096 (+) Transcript_6447:257-3544(+)
MRASAAARSGAELCLCEGLRLGDALGDGGGVSAGALGAARVAAALAAAGRDRVRHPVLGREALGLQRLGHQADGGEGPSGDAEEEHRLVRRGGLEGDGCGIHRLGVRLRQVEHRHHRVRRRVRRRLLAPCLALVRAQRHARLGRLLGLLDGLGDERLERLGQAALGQVGHGRRRDVHLERRELRVELRAGELARLRDARLERLRHLHRLPRRRARHRREPPHAARDALLPHHAEDLDVLGVGEVRAAAELDGVVAPAVAVRLRHQLPDRHAHGEHAHGVRVGLPEDAAQGLDLLRRLERLHLREDGPLRRHLRVHQLLDAAHLLVGERAAEGEVEARPVLGDEGAALVRALADHGAQGVVEDVRGRVVLGDGRAARVVHRRRHRVAHLDARGSHGANVQHEARVLLHVLNLEGRAAPAGRVEAARVVDLPALLRVEGRRVQHHAAARARRHAVHEARLLPRVDGLDGGGDARALPLGSVPGVLWLVVRGVHAHLAEAVNLVRLEHEFPAVAEVARGAALLLGLLQQRLEGRRVHLEALLLRHELCQVHGEAEGGEEQVHVLARHRVPLGQLGGALGELLEAVGQGARELLLLLLDHRDDVLGLGAQLREGVAHEIHQRGHELVEEACGRLEDVRPVAHGAAEDAAEHVAAALVGGHGAVRHGEREGPDVVGDDAVRRVHPVSVVHGPELAGVGARARLLLDGGEDGLEDVSVVVGAHVLEHGDEALEAHARVDVLGGQGPQLPRGLAVELDENEVPDLEHVRVVHVDETRGVAPADAVVVDLGAGPAGARVAHLPKVVLHAEWQHAVLGHVLAPHGLGLEVRLQALRRVALEVGEVEAVRVDAVGSGEQLPRPVDGLLLEVVAEGPVAQHFKKGVVVHVLAHVVEVVVLAARTDALLRVGRALELGHVGRRVRLAEENGLELVHARVDEEQRGVVEGHHRGGCPEGVVHALGLAEEIDEGVAHVRGRGEGAATATAAAAGTARRLARLQERCECREGLVRTAHHHLVHHVVQDAREVVRLEIGGELRLQLHALGGGRGRRGHGRGGAVQGTELGGDGRERGRGASGKHLVHRRGERRLEGVLREVAFDGSHCRGC